MNHSSGTTIVHSYRMSKSEYELLREVKMAENKARLAELGLPALKADIVRCSSSRKLRSLSEVHVLTWPSPGGPTLTTALQFMIRIQTNYLFSLTPIELAPCLAYSNLSFVPKNQQQPMLSLEIIQFLGKRPIGKTRKSKEKTERLVTREEALFVSNRDSCPGSSRVPKRDFTVTL